MSHDEIVETIRKKYERVAGVLDERGRRVWAAAEAEALGYGGQSLVARATGMSRMTLYAEHAGNVEKPEALQSPHRIRKWEVAARS